jgi:hypothetical protein
MKFNLQGQKQKCGIFPVKNFSTKYFFLVAGFYILFSVFYFPFSIKVTQAQEWQEIKSEHAVVSFINNEEFAKDVSRQTEVYYRRIASELAYQRYSEFWTWDNRVKIYIYPDRASYLKETGQPEWSEGLASYTDKKISSYAWSEGFLNMLLPHELTHLIFRDYVGFKGEVPLWLDEGVAQWMEPHKRKAVQRVMKRIAQSGNVLSLRQMMTLDVRRSSDAHLVEVYYVQAVSLVDFLITKYSAPRFTNFCRQLRDGKTIEEGLRFAYPIAIRDIDEFETKWKQYIMEE